MDRDTKEIQVGENKIVVKTYATAREHQAIQQAYFKGTKFEVVGEKPNISEINPGVMFDVQQEMVRQLVLSMNGNAESVLDRCLDLPQAEFAAVVAVLDEIVSKKKS